MIVPIFDIDVQINKKSIPTDTVVDLRRLYEYLGKFLTWLDHAPEYSETRTFSNINLQAPQEQEEDANLGELLPSVGVLKEQSKLTTSDYAILAIGFLGGSAPYSLSVKKALSLGWQTRATDPKNIARTFEVMARQRGDLITVGKGMMRLTEAGQIAFEKMRHMSPFASQPLGTDDETNSNERSENQPSSIVTSSSGFIKRAFGNRAIDILVLAIYESGKPVGYSDAPALVQRYGWNALDDSANPKLLIISKARKYPELVTSTDGRFWLTSKGREHGQRVQNYLAERRGHLGNEQRQLFATAGE